MAEVLVSVHSAFECIIVHWCYILKRYLTAVDKWHVFGHSTVLQHQEA
jgi:hypothetical protein